MAECSLLAVRYEPPRRLAIIPLRPHPATPPTARVLRELQQEVLTRPRNLRHMIPLSFKELKTSKPVSTTTTPPQTDMIHLNLRQTSSHIGICCLLGCMSNEGRHLAIESTNPITVLRETRTTNSSGELNSRPGGSSRELLFWEDGMNRLASGLLRNISTNAPISPAAVLDFRSPRNERIAIGPRGRDSIIQRVVESGRFTAVVDRDSLDRALSETALQQTNAGTDFDSGTLVRAGRLVGASVVILGQAEVEGDACHISVRMVQVDSGQITAATSVDIRNDDPVVNGGRCDAANSMAASPIRTANSATASPTRNTNGAPAERAIAAATDTPRPPPPPDIFSFAYEGTPPWTQNHVEVGRSAYRLLIYMVPYVLEFSVNGNQICPTGDGRSVTRFNFAGRSFCGCLPSTQLRTLNVLARDAAAEQVITITAYNYNTYSGGVTSQLGSPLTIRITPQRTDAYGVTPSDFH